MDATWQALITALSGNPALLVLCFVLAGGGWLGYKILRSHLSHSRKMQDEFFAHLVTNTSSMSKSLEILNDKVDNVTVELKEIAVKVGQHEIRIQRLEDR